MSGLIKQRKMEQPKATRLSVMFDNFFLLALITRKVSNVWGTFIAVVKKNFNASMLMNERVKKYDIYLCFSGDLSVIYTFQLKNGV